MTKFDDKILSFAPGALLELYDLDLGKLGGPMLRFTPAREEVTPAENWRLRDTNSNGLTVFQCPSPIALAVGDRIILDGYVKMATGGWPILRLGKSLSANYRDFQLNVGTMATSIVNNGTSGLADPVVRLSAAAEWVYFSIVARVESLGPFYLFAFPTAGTTYPNRANAATGSLDIFGFRAATMRGGTRVPLPLETDVSLWTTTATAAQGNVEIMPNTAQAWKVPVWNGNPYTPIPIKSSGYEKSGTGPFPRPKLTMSNLFNEGSALSQEFGDMRGAVCTRRRVYADNLDNGPDPDGAAGYPPDIFKVDRMAMSDGQTIEWELASVLDQQGVMLPNRQMLRDTCPWVYRVWDGTKFVYGEEDACPYTGAAMFDTNGNPVTNPEQDRCSHTFKQGCRKRFSSKEETPFGAFPMLGRLSL